MRIAIVLRLPDDIYDEDYGYDPEILAEELEIDTGGIVETITELRDE